MLQHDLTCIIQRGKKKSILIAEAVAKGAPGRARILYDDQGYLTKPSETPIIIGLWPSTLEVMRAFHSRRRAYVTIDNGYFQPYKEGGYFRATLNGLQWQSGKSPEAGREYAKARFESLGETISPWRQASNGHILIVLQSDRWYQMMGNPQWISQTLAGLNTERRVILRHKPIKGAIPQPTLAEHLTDCHAVIGYSSNALIKATMAGVPVFPLAPCSASSLGLSDLRLLENPIRPDRESVYHQLAAHQWTLDEMSDGTMWRHLSKTEQSSFLSIA